MADTDSPPAAAAEATRAGEAEQRRAHRLADDLGINPAGVQVVLRLRRQLVLLQARTRQLEGELRLEQARSTARLARYRSEYYEATWEDTL